ncbi:MAG: hypothetical protein IPP34_15855 [Bacteroidetes bacterium]|nr:hypothetical protein [Bacteroidota bacterium]
MIAQLGNYSWLASWLNVAVAAALIGLGVSITGIVVRFVDRNISDYRLFNTISKGYQMGILRFDGRQF